MRKNITFRRTTEKKSCSFRTFIYIIILLYLLYLICMVFSNSVLKSITRTTPNVAQDAFMSHPSHGALNLYNISEYMRFLSLQPQCTNKPIFTTMARVKSKLYWELIENFFHTMHRFGHLDCAVMICISDPGCVKLCQSKGFPCYDYRHPNISVHTMEQVATVKLYHIGVGRWVITHL